MTGGNCIAAIFAWPTSVEARCAEPDATPTKLTIRSLRLRLEVVMMFIGL